MHLKPLSMQDYTLLQKKCIIKLSSHALVPLSQSFDCIIPTEALNVVFKYNEIEPAPVQLNWQSVRGVSCA